jgi:hypothetical protein
MVRGRRAPAHTYMHSLYWWLDGGAFRAWQPFSRQQGQAAVAHGLRGMVLSMQTAQVVLIPRAQLMAGGAVVVCWCRSGPSRRDAQGAPVANLWPLVSCLAAHSISA